MNGSGANVAGCATCHGRCCREYRVEVNVADVRALAAGTGFHPRDFLTLYQADERRGGFRLAPSGPPYELNLLRRQGTNGCVFLMELDGGLARCGVYAHRPTICRTFPTVLSRRAVAIREDVICGPRSWNVAAMDLPAYRRDLVRRDADWEQHHSIVSAWNAIIDVTATAASANDLYEFLVTWDPQASASVGASER